MNPYQLGVVMIANVCNNALQYFPDGCFCATRHNLIKVLLC